ncbi:MAG: glucosamine--fructose-6-phosphate aminotransferase (isomerizing) [Olleya marilimosa]|jgi:glucosamine--fructose-6-phosphate aminotransferase (isomerizing)|uniref:glutamine--fructose-6-phosphate transaminase (isomerizing) n=1 Tax=Olleya marilimosa TaxID=272164 RepID=UPI0004895688|nr:glutamine--fructose-6-phosphate transaminase (isomerizing) [Olleya marilimosa]|tara:strand:+ start:324665 stop:326512 length:1848 start_codon:yes stop_codon:yes gene_type:complete
MCGIVGYIGHREAYPIVMEGLKRLEYRGYDSAGIALYDGSDIKLSKTKGKVADLEERVKEEITTEGTIGIGHTRWATHGVPNDVNSHPHYSNSGDLVIIHNGIIENYDSIKTELIKRGYVFKSDTDTEVLINLIEEVKKKQNVKLGKAVQLALNEVVGAYAIAVFDKNKPNEIVVAKLGSPLAIGIGDDEFFIASDASPFIEFTKNAIYLEDEEMAIVRRDKKIKIRKIKDDSEVNPSMQELKFNLEQIEKGGYEHFMLKEIHEQPNAIRDTYRGRLLAKEGIIRMAGIDDNIEKFLNANRIIIVACGTSWHAGLVAEYIFEDLARIPVEVEYASEFRYRNPVITEKDVVIAISQSGETADTLAAIKLAKSKGAFVFGVCNVVGSTIARETNAGAYTHAGPEIGVASTKAFTTQITVLTLIALKLAKANGSMSNSVFHHHLQELELIPEKVKEALKADEHIKKVAEIYKDAKNCLYLGRGYNFPVALEGALKLKEISYIHAEGYPAAEMKHGPIALIDEQMPVFVIATKKGHYEKVVSNIQEIKSRSGKIIGIVTTGDVDVKNVADHVIEVPETIESLTPLLTTIPLQLLSYHIAVMLEKNVDQPRNLAKSVTVE